MERFVLLALVLALPAACAYGTETETATVDISVSTTGEAVDDAYVVNVDNGVTALSVDGDEEFTVVVVAGTHSFELTQVTANCSVDGPNPVTLTLEEGDVGSVDFEVICVEA